MKKLLLSIITLLTINAFSADVWQSVIKGTFYQESGLGVSYQVILNDEKISEGQITIPWETMRNMTQEQKETLINAQVFDASNEIKIKYNAVKVFDEMKDIIAVKNGKDLNDNVTELMAVKYVEPVREVEVVTPVEDVKTEVVQEEIKG